MAANAWCFDATTDTIGTLPDVKEAYLAELEDVHDQINDEEWADIVEPMNLSDHGLDKLEEQPSWEDLYNWSTIVEPFSGTKQRLPDFVEEQRLLVATIGSLNALNKGLSSVSENKLASGFDTTEETALIGALNSLQPIEYLQGGYKNNTIGEFINNINNLNQLNYASSVEPVPEQGNVFNTTLLAFSQEVQKNAGLVSSLGCDTNFKDEYTQALLKMALPCINDMAEREGIDPIIPETIEDFFAGAMVPGMLMRAAASMFGIEQIEDLKKKIQNSIEGKIQEEIDEALADNIIFREQCFLLANLGDLVNYKKEQSDSLPLPYITQIEESAGGRLAAPLESNPDTGQSEESSVSPAALPPQESVYRGNEPINIQGEAFGFMNKLAIDPSQAQLFELKPHEISSITPHMRFYKVTFDKEKNKDVETEITFDTNVSKDLVQYMERGGRGLGVGVRNFTFSYDGTDPFSAKKSIQAKLSIYATSFTELLRERDGGFKYVDLALKTGRSKKLESSNLDELSQIERENLDKLNFRLKAVVEWTASKESLKLIRNDDLKNAIYNSAITIYLTPTIHEFDFDETGAVTFDINYLAYIEDYFSNPNFDIFASITNEKRARDLVYDYFREQNCDITQGDDFAEFRKKDENYIARLNTNSLSSIIGGLRKRQKIYYISTSKEEMQAWLKSPIDNSFMKDISTAPGSDIDVVAGAANAALETPSSAGDDEARDAYRLSLVANSDKRENVAFFYLSDLVSIVLNNISISLEASGKVSDSNYLEIVTGDLKLKAKIRTYIKDRMKDGESSKLKATQDQFKKLRIILGPMEAYPYSATKTATPALSCTVGDIPISLNYFLDFMSEKVLAKQVTQYPLSKFIKDIVNDTIRNFLNSDDCFRSNSSQKISLNSTTVIGYNTKARDNSEDDVTALIMEQMNAKSGAAAKNCLLSSKLSSKNLPIIKISGPRDQPRSKLSIDKMINYYVFSAGRRYPVENYVGDKAADSSRGIFHYLLGENKGIVKNIKLDKTTATGLKELRFEQEGYDGLTQLREVYNANVETFLNPQTFPGTYIYVEPKGFDPTATEDLTRFGIGGYYMITKTTHTIAPGNAETQLNAAWVASKGNNKAPKTAKEAAKIKRQEEGTEKVKKCKVHSLSNNQNNR
tara:strand:- start:79 stop:3522 length:3444 start_codon:yes stop_codon:yes gene_type:complete